MGARSGAGRVIAALAVMLAVTGCTSTADPSALAVVSSPSPAPPATAAPTATPAATPTATATPTPRPAATPTPEPEPTPTMRPLPNARRGTITIDELGLTLTLPKGWESIGLNADDVQAMMGALPEGMFAPDFADQVNTMVASGLRLLAVDLRPKHLGASVNILVTPRIPPSMLEATSQLGISFLEGATIISSKAVTIDGQPCRRAEIRLEMVVGGTKQTILETQLYLTRPDSTVVLTVAIPKGGSLKDRDAIVNSIRLHE